MKPIGLAFLALLCLACWWLAMACVELTPSVRHMPAVLPHALAVLVPGAIGSAYVGGLEGIRSTGRFLVDRAGPGDLRLASSCLTLATRCVLVAGLAVSTVGAMACLKASAELNDPNLDVGLADVGAAAGWALVPELFGVFLGRGILGTLADRATTLAGRSADAGRTGVSDLLVLAYLFPTSLAILFLFRTS